MLYDFTCTFKNWLAICFVQCKPCHPPHHSQQTFGDLGPGRLKILTLEGEIQATISQTNDQRHCQTPADRYDQAMAWMHSFEGGKCKICHADSAVKNSMFNIYFVPLFDYAVCIAPMILCTVYSVNTCECRNFHDHDPCHGIWMLTRSLAFVLTRGSQGWWTWICNEELSQQVVGSIPTASSSNEVFHLTGNSRGFPLWTCLLPTGIPIVRMSIHEPLAQEIGQPVHLLPFCFTISIQVLLPNVSQ